MLDCEGVIEAGSRALERRILSWMCVLIAVNQLGFGAVIPVLPLYAKSFDVSQTAIGATVAVYGVARVFLGLPTGKVADVLGRRAALAIGGGVTVLGNLWCAMAATYLELLTARLVAGAGAGIVLTAGLIVLADIASPATRGRTLAIYQGVFLFAVGIGPFPGGFLAERFGLEAPFLVYAIMGAAVTAVAWFGVAETRVEGGTPASRDAVPLRAQVRALLGDVGFRLVCFIGLVGALARTGGLFSIVPILGRERLALSATEIGFGFALGSIVGLLVTYPAGYMADRFGRKAVIVPATVLIGVSMLAFSFAADYAWFLVACLIWGGAITASGAAPAAYAADAAPEGMNAAAMGSYRMLSDVGYVVGPIVLGWMGDAGGLDLPLWAAAGGLFLMAALFGAFASETVRKEGTA
ncbi:MAG: MFS transporter [Gammaproteobacteria bacterium]|nr:MFS transporter [Gammaproteobacteria bacterium]MXY56611.1 MFS transporter [Gammaproteobacteria bacterium]MYF28401.1 MFS transporter [Gammaproteobacteria bacterium]MYK46976.1 MFS transporter [Gammaproteobacteria bacterium]